jgi:formaldehyde-activating enzyme involved in methanogenesis
LLEDGKNLIEELKMGVHVSCGEENVIQVYKNNGKMGKKAIHEALKGLGSIAKAKRHVNVFKKAKRRCYCSFRDIRRSNGT